MADPFLGEIRIFAATFAPLGWAFCEGQTMSIADNTALFSLLGTTYGGDGQVTFALPDLRGRMPVHFGQGAGLSPYNLGTPAGAERVGLSPGQIPAHSHVPQALSPNGSQPGPGGALWASSSAAGYSSAAPGASMEAGLIGGQGGGQAHENRMPFLALNFIIALQGIFPSRN